MVIPFYHPLVRKLLPSHSISRKFKATERIDLDLRVESFNVTNHPNFNAPSTSNPTSSTFGQIKTAQDPRIMQGAFKVIF